MAAGQRLQRLPGLALVDVVSLTPPKYRLLASPAFNVLSSQQLQVLFIAAPQQRAAAQAAALGSASRAMPGMQVLPVLSAQRAVVARASMLTAAQQTNQEQHQQVQASQQQQQRQETPAAGAGFGTARA